MIITRDSEEEEELKGIFKTFFLPLSPFFADSGRKPGKTRTWARCLCGRWTLQAAQTRARHNVRKPSPANGGCRVYAEGQKRLHGELAYALRVRWLDGWGWGISPNLCLLASLSKPHWQQVFNWMNHSFQMFNDKSIPGSEKGVVGWVFWITWFPMCSALNIEDRSIAAIGTTSIEADRNCNCQMAVLFCASLSFLLSLFFLLFPSYPSHFFLWLF